MSIACPRHAIWRATGIATLLMLSSLLFFSDIAAALLYRAPEGSLKENCVVWNDGTFYLFTMYRREQQIADVRDQWRNVWLATSTDGVHWKDVGPVIKDAPFVIYAMRVWKVGDRYLMNHGSYTGEKQDDLVLLKDVVRHKKVFFDAAYANYDACLERGLRLVTDEPFLAALRQDYRQMESSGMFDETPPSFDEIVGVLRQIEDVINH
jgi:hypothetical protein